MCKKTILSFTVITKNEEKEKPSRPTCLCLSAVLHLSPESLGKWHGGFTTRPLERLQSRACQRRPPLSSMPQSRFSLLSSASTARVSQPCFCVNWVILLIWVNHWRFDHFSVSFAFRSCSPPALSL